MIIPNYERGSWAKKLEAVLQDLGVGLLIISMHLLWLRAVQITIDLEIWRFLY